MIVNFFAKCVILLQNENFSVETLIFMFPSNVVNKFLLFINLSCLKHLLRKFYWLSNFCDLWQKTFPAVKLISIFPISAVKQIFTARSLSWLEHRTEIFHDKKNWWHKDTKIFQRSRVVIVFILLYKDRCCHKHLHLYINFQYLSDYKELRCSLLIHFQTNFLLWYLIYHANFG